MPGVVWDSTLETGNAKIDSQHQALFRLFTDLHDIVLRGADAGDVGRMTERLSAYVAVHFEDERQLMLSSSYPMDRLLAHVEQHNALAQRTHELAAAYRAGDLTTIIPIVTLMQEWLADHVRKTDRELVEYMQELEKVAAE